MRRATCRTRREMLMSVISLLNPLGVSAKQHRSRSFSLVVSKTYTGEDEKMHFSL